MMHLLSSTTLARAMHRSVASFTAAATFALAAPSSALATDEHHHPRRSDPIVGLWAVKVTVIDCQSGKALPLPFGQRNPFDAMNLFGADGSLHDTNATDPRQRSSSFGSWQRQEHGAYLAVFRFFRFEASGTGAPIGSQIVRQKITLADDSESYEANVVAELFDIDGNPVGGRCVSAAGTRFR